MMIPVLEAALLRIPLTQMALLLTQPQPGHSLARCVFQPCVSAPKTLALCDAMLPRCACPGCRAACAAVCLLILRCSYNNGTMRTAAGGVTEMAGSIGAHVPQSGRMQVTL
jgi:hypothetical protein